MEVKSFSGQIQTQDICSLEECIRSPELYFFCMNNNHIAYLPFQQLAIKLSDEEYVYIKDNETPSANLNPDLIKYFIYVNKNKLSVDKTKNIHIANERDINPHNLVLLLTTKCDKKCVYCYAEGGTWEHLSLDPNSVKFLVEKYEISEICFFGLGEPTLEFELIKEIVKLTKYKNPRYGIITHGEYYPKKRREMIINYFVENKFSVVLSLDGPPEIHDLQRPSKENLKQKPSELIEKTIEEFKKLGDINHFCVPRTTISKYSENRLREIIDYFLELGFTNCALEGLNPFGRATENSDVPCAQPPNISIVAKNIFDAYIYAKERGMSLKCHPFIFEKPAMYPCEPVGLQALVLGPTKEDKTYISACYHLQEDSSKFRIGHLISTGKQFGDQFEMKLDFNKIRALKKRNSEDIEACNSCPIKCGGGCYSTALRIETNKEDCSQAVYKQECSVKRWSLLQRIKYLFEH